MTGIDLLASAFDDADLAPQGTAAYLVTVGPDAWPHAAMLSVGEVVVRPDGACAIALWAGSRTSTNLRGRPETTLLAVVGEQAVRARLRLSPAPDADLPGSVALSCFVGNIVEAVAETAPYARIVSGVGFVLREPDTALPRWAATRAHLRALLRRDTEGDGDSPRE